MERKFPSAERATYGYPKWAENGTYVEAFDYFISSSYFFIQKESFQGLSRPVGPANRILNSKAPFVIVIPTTSPYNLFAAQRMAHNLLSYLRIDAQIFLDREAIKRLGRGDLGCANIAILGGHDNLFGEALMSGNPGSVVFTKGGWRLRGREFEHPGQGASNRYRRRFL